MKKVQSVSFNFRFMRIPFFLCLLFLVVKLSILTYHSIPPLTLNNDFIGIILNSGAPVSKKATLSGRFSLMTLNKRTNTLSADSNKAVADVSASQKKDTVNEETLPLKAVQPPGEVLVSNSAGKEINISEFLGKKPGFLSGDLSVLIVHTHTTESYTPSDKYSYTPTDTDRTTDKNYNMVRVGSKIYDTLTEKGIKVTHDTTINDYPSYNGSYNRSSMNVKNAINNDPSFKIVLDVHRDAIENNDAKKTKFTANIDGQTAACVMLVVGSNLSGLDHSNWKENMNFAATLQEHIQSVYPGLMRPINFRSQRFNQQLAPGAIIVEVGTNGNTLDEALLGAQCFAEGLADYIDKYSN